MRENQPFRPSGLYDRVAGQTGLVQAQLLVTQHRFAISEEILLRNSARHRSGHCQHHFKGRIKTVPSRHHVWTRKETGRTSQRPDWKDRPIRRRQACGRVGPVDAGVNVISRSKVVNVRFHVLRERSISLCVPRITAVGIQLVGCAILIVGMRRA